MCQGSSGWLSGKISSIKGWLSIRTLYSPIQWQLVMSLFVYALRKQKSTGWKLCKFWIYLYDNLWARIIFVRQKGKNMIFFFFILQEAKSLRKLLLPCCWTRLFTRATRMVKDITHTKNKLVAKWLQDSKRVSENFLEKIMCWKKNNLWLVCMMSI